MAAHKLEEILAGSAELNALSRLARRQSELQRLILESAPRALAGATRITGFRAGTLVVSADNAATAAKLRQLAPRLLLTISEREPEVTKIRVEVQPAAAVPATRPQARKHALSADTVENFRKLADALPDSALKSSVARLVGRRKAGAGRS